MVDINLVLTLHFTYYLTSQKSTITRGVEILPRVDFGWVRLCVKRRLFFWGGASPFYHMGAIFARFGAASEKARRVLRVEANEKTFSIFTIKFTCIHERFIDYIRQSRRPLSVRRGTTPVKLGRFVDSHALCFFRKKPFFFESHRNGNTKR